MKKKRPYAARLVSKKLDPYEQLANAIIIKAANDYRRAKKHDDPVRIAEVEAFFKSEYAQRLSPATQYIFEKLKEEGGEKK